MCKERLGAKLRFTGLPAIVVSFLESWLEDRVACVVVSGAKSDDQVLANSVFQGTVLGPPLWNYLYADARFSVRHHAFTEIVFAEDLNAFRAFTLATPNASVMVANNACQI